MVLGIETSELLCSVAFTKNTQIMVEYNHEIPRQHASLLGILVKKGGEFLSDNNFASANFVDSLELVAVATGPGSFTGLRIGLSYAQGLCLGRHIPIIGVNNHQVLAESYPYGFKSVFTIIDARRDEVYLAEMELNDKKYFEIQSHDIVEKKDLPDVIVENSALLYNSNTDLENSIIQALLKKQISIVNSVRYSAAVVAKIGWQQYQQTGGDGLSELEPLYIRPFAGVQ